MARIDLKNNGDETNTIILLNDDNSKYNVSQPSWFMDSKGIGFMITSINKKLKLSFECINDGKLKIDFKSIDYRDENDNRIPIYIDYKEIEIDGESIIDGSTVLSHDNPLSYEKDVKDGQIVDIKINYESLN